MILDVVRVVNVAFGIVVGACFIGGLIAGLVAGNAGPETVDLDASEWHEEL